jgi:hypothetical protein
MTKTRIERQSVFSEDSFSFPGTLNFLRKRLSNLSRIDWKIMKNGTATQMTKNHPIIVFGTNPPKKTEKTKVDDPQTGMRHHCDLSKLMWDINRSLSTTFNKMRATNGHLWGSRFKSLLIESDDSLLKVMSYIELNPVRAGMVDDPRDYRFGSVGRLTHPEWGEAGIEIPLAGFLRCASPKKRIRKYLPWLPALAKATRGEKLAISIRGPISEAAPQVDETMAEFASGLVTDWYHQAFGSKTFHGEVQKVFKKRKHQLRVSRIARSARASPYAS